MSAWRTGRKVGRTIYNGDTLIGVMDTPVLASAVCIAVNSHNDLVPIASRIADLEWKIAEAQELMSMTASGDWDTNDSYDRWLARRDAWLATNGGGR